jgi:YVTN family beta-propeller protein
VTSTVNAYTINSDGSLTSVPGSPFATGGMNGKAVAVTPDGKRLYVSNQGSNNVSGFDIAGDGSLTAIAGSPWLTGGTSPDLESIVITPNQPPLASFSAQPASAGSSSSFNGNPSVDLDGTVTGYRWDFGDGTLLVSGGPTPRHTFGRAGTFTVTLTLTDNEGCGTVRVFTGKATLCNGSRVATIARQVTIPPPGSGPVAPLPPVNPLAPRILSASVRPAVFRVRRGTRFRYSLSAAARLVFTIDRRLPGRRVGRRCAAPTRSNRGRRRCTRLRRVGSFARASVAGANVKRFSGRIGGRRLAPGRYRARLVARAGGLSSLPRLLYFRVVR